MAGRTQEALYSEIALELSWSEAELPQVARTKHVHALHPYLGKFIPQLVDVFLRRHFQPGDCVYDPFAGSGTTLVEANAYGVHSIGCDISVFNCLLARVKTNSYPLGSLELALRSTLEQARQTAEIVDVKDASKWLRKWYAPPALRELLAYECVASESLEDPMWRTCAPVQEAAKFLRRYTADTVRRIRDFAAVRTTADVTAIHADARFAELPCEIDGIITSPPYPGLIDYHEQHRYAYELLRLPDLRTEEIGAAEFGVSRRALDAYIDGIAAAFRNAHRFMTAQAPVVIVVNDSRNLYPTILERAGLSLEERLTRHVNRRTGRRAGEFFEDVLVCRSNS